MGRGLPFFFRCQQSRVRVSHLAAGVQSSRGNPTEKGGQGGVDLVSMDSARNVEQVGDVLGASASWARSGEGRVVQARKGPVPGAYRRCRRGSQIRVALSRGAKVGGRNEPSGGLPISGNSCSASRSITSGRRVRSASLLPESEAFEDLGGRAQAHGD